LILIEFELFDVTGIYNIRKTQIDRILII